MTRKGLTQDNARTLLPLVEAAISSYSGNSPKDLDAQQDLFDIRKTLLVMAGGKPATAPKPNARVSRMQQNVRAAVPGIAEPDQETA